MTVTDHGDAGDLVSRARRNSSGGPLLSLEEEMADCIEALEAECATWKDACHSAESRIEHFLTRTSGLESAERVVKTVRVYMKIHKGPWPPDTYISRLDKALAAHDKETGA